MSRWERLARLVGDRLRIPDAGPATVEPLAEEFDEVMAIAHEEHWRVRVLGRGARAHWGNPVMADLVILTRRLDRLIEHAPAELIAIAEAGMTLAELNDRLAEAGQWLPLEVPFPELTTLGGLVAAAPQALGRAGYGQVRDWLIGLEVINEAGERLRCGGRVVKNVAGYDLLKLYTGSMGSLGAIARVTFKLRPRDRHMALVQLPLVDPARHAKALEHLQTCLPSPAVAVMETHPGGWLATLGFEGAPETVAAQIAEVTAMGALLGSEVSVLEGEAARDARRKLADRMEPSSGWVARASVLPADLLTFHAEAVALARGAGIHAFAQLHHGALWLRMDLPDGRVGAAIALAWRARARARQGNLVIERHGSERERVEAWGVPAAARSLMRRVRERLDPGDRLACGMFADPPAGVTGV